MRKKVGILISGRGSNMASLVAACKEDDYPAEVVVVISNRPDAVGLVTAGEAGIPTATVDHRTFEDREGFEAELSRVLDGHDVELVCLAGFMRLLTATFVDHWRDRLINIHPSLLPAYPGVNIHDRVIDDGVRISGCTVHFVRSEMDSGPIIAQAAVPVLAGDTVDDLAARVLKAEHRIYPLALKLVASGRVRVASERVLTDYEETEAESLHVPAIAGD